MLLTIVDTKSYGKFVMHLYPYQPLNHPKDDVTPLELTEALTTSFQYFGMYQKSDVITTSTGGLKQGTVIHLFQANQKYTQVVMGLDQNCILISKSSFLDSSRPLLHSQHTNQIVQLGQFISLNDVQLSIVNSISLVYRQDSFDNIQQIKHKLSFLVSALETKEKHSKYLSRQVAMIVEEKNQFKRILKDKCSMYLKQNNAIYEQFKIKMIYKQVQGEAQTLIKKIHIFQLLQKIYSCWDKKQFFKSQLLFDDYFLTSINSMNLKIPSAKQSKQKIKSIENKTIVTIQLKLNSLPAVFSSHERIQYIYDRLLTNNSKPLKNLVSNQMDISVQSVYHTVYFLMRNDLAVAVYPFDPQRYYSLYTLKSMPDKKVIQKFNSLFQGENILDYLKKFEKYYRIRYLDEKVKYLLLNKIIKQVSIFIQKLQPINERNRVKSIKMNVSGLRGDNSRGQNNSSVQAYPSAGFIKETSVEAILNQKVTKPEEINTILGYCKEKGIKMSELINFVKHNSNYWKFIFIEKVQ